MTLCQIAVFSAVNPIMLKILFIAFFHLIPNKSIQHLPFTISQFHDR